MRSSITGWVAIVAVFFSGFAAEAQNASKAGEPGSTYKLRLPVDEVVLTFNATDSNGLAVHDLKVEEIRLWDNGAAPRRVIAFDQLVNRQMRVGILLDTSESVQNELPVNKAIAKRFVVQIFRRSSDEAFVSEFGFASDLIQPWTGDVPLLLKAAETAQPKGNSPGGTALFNAVFRACSSSFGETDPTATGNLLLLFSDGEDNAGLTSMDEAARACQRSNAQVFAFVPASAELRASTGPRALRELVAKTGGRVFVADDSEDAIGKDLDWIESEMRDQYRLVYAPANLKDDGAFHQIMLQPPDRVSKVEVRSGYFAPRH